ncbi:MAG: hypothetical protein HY939_01675 [Gammaproteobacteria bacterium]|nr:hypothetical protein [Gammaproteobacteria bacterium]
MATETNFVKLLKLHAQTLRTAFLAIKSAPGIPYDMGLKQLLEVFTLEFSTKSPGFFPGQIGPKRLMEFYNQFNQYVPGFSGQNVKAQGAYSREVTMRLREFMDAIYADLQNKTVTLPWLFDKLGSVFVRGDSVRSRLFQFVAEKTENLDRALR